MNGFRLLALRAIRLARRAPVRSLATGCLVAVAVLGGSFWLSESRGHYEFNSSPTAVLGAADVRYNLFDHGFVGDLNRVAAQVDIVLAALPHDSETAVTESYHDVRVGSATAHDIVSIHQGPWDHPLLDGMVDLVEGRLPSPGEVVVSPSLAVSLGVDIGDQLVVRRPVATLDVVGLGTTGSWAQLVVAEDEFVLSEPAELATDRPEISAAVLADLPAGAVAPDVPLSGSDPDPTVARPLQRDALEFPPPTGTSTGAVATVVMFVGLTAGAAFGIGATRRRRALGLLAANGATAGQLRLAAGAEALVVSAPAALLGALAAVVLPPVWVRLRLPRWDLVWQLVVPLRWVGALVLASLAAAAIGAVAFSRSTTTTPVPALLDGRAAHRGVHRAAPALRHVVVVVVVLASLSVLLLGGATVPALLALAAVLTVWSAAATGLVAGARRLLSRRPIGRVVARDLARRPLGAAATVIIIAAWSLFSVMWILSPNLGGNDRSGSFVDPLADSARPASIGAERSNTLTVRPALPTSIEQRSSAAQLDGSPTLPPGLREELSDLGLVTRPATVGEYIGPCDVCPEGFRPSVMVLDSTDGLDLPEGTAAALLSGSVVTGFPVANVDDAVVSELPVIVASLPLPVSAAMLEEFAPDDTALERPTEVLVGSAGGLTDTQAAAVMLAIAEAGGDAVSDDLRFAPVGSAVAARGLDGFGPTTNPALWWMVVLVAPALVALAATVSYRREHTEAAQVLWLLGAGPRAVRRLAGLTASTLAGVGVLIGTFSSAAVVATMIVSRVDLGVGDVLGFTEGLAIIAIIVVVPANARAFASIRPLRTAQHDAAPA